MTNIQAELSDPIYRAVREMAEQEGIPLERLAGIAIAQALGAWNVQRSAFLDRATRGHREKFLHAMDKAGNEPPISGDEGSF